MKKGRSHLNGRTGHSANTQRIHTVMNRSIKVPQKGKIRVFLVLLLIIAGGKEVLSFVHDKVSLTPEERIAVQAAKEQRRAEKMLRKKMKSRTGPVDQLPKLAKARGFTYSNLITTIEESPPTLTAACDTVEWKKSMVIRYFSIDTTLQTIGNKLMTRHHPKHAAMVVIQPRTGRVLSLISYNNPKDQPFGEDLFLNSRLPAASIFKTVTAAAVIEKNGLTPEYEFPLIGNAHTLYKNQIAKDIRPSAKMTLAEAYAFSVNPVFGRMGLYHAGINTLQEYAEKFGFNDSVPFELPVGVSRFTPETDTFAIAELASGYNKKTSLSPMLGALIAGGISSGGKIIRPTLVDSVKDLKTGKIIYEVKPRYWRVIMSETGAAQMKKLMQATTIKGTARRSFATIKGTRALSSFQHGGKTGNINTDPEMVTGRVEWFIGFLKDSSLTDEDLACAVVQVHGQTWNVHSSFLGGEMMRFGIKSIQDQKKAVIEKKAEADSLAALKASGKDTAKTAADSAQKK